jgi:type II secretory pathway component PulF
MQSILGAWRALDDGKHRAEFYRMWRVGYAAAFTHPKSLETMGPRQSPQTETLRRWILDGTYNGKTLTDLVKAGGKRFEDFESALLTLGEQTGRLDDTLRLLGDFYMKKQELINAVKKKMAYPMFNLVAACFIAPLIFAFTGRIGTYFALAFGSVTLVVAAGGSIVGAVAARYGRKPAMARARMARALAIAIEAGLTLPRALRMAAQASANPEIRNHVWKLSEKQLASQSAVVTLAGCPHLTPDFVNFLQTAEKTGDYSMLTKLADLYEDGFR